MSLEGVLSDFGVGEIFQLIGQQRKTGVLEVKSRARTFEIHFVDGQVLRARPSESRADGALAGFLLRTGVVADSDLAEAWREQEETLDPLEDVLLAQQLVSKEDIELVSQLLTSETIFELFLWDEGRFVFRPEEVHERTGDRLLGAEGVLLDALRMRDEWAQVQAGLPDFSVVLAPTMEAERYAERREELEAAAGLCSEYLDRLYRLCDGRLTIRRVIDLSKQGTFQAGRGLLTLLEQGVLHVERQTRASAEESAVGRWQKRLSGPWIVLTAAPLAAILLLLPTPSADTFVLPQPGLHDACDQAELERLRSALEAYRWSTGAYPESLRALRARSQALLAPVRLDRYSYQSSRSGGYALTRVR